MLSLTTDCIPRSLLYYAYNNSLALPLPMMTLAPALQQPMAAPKPQPTGRHHSRGWLAPRCPLQLADKPARPPAGPPTAARTTNAHTTHTHPPCLASPTGLLAPGFFSLMGPPSLFCARLPAREPRHHHHTFPLPSVLLSTLFFFNQRFFLSFPFPVLSLS